MDQMEERGFAEQDLSPDERVALQTLLELGRPRRGHLAWWGRKQRRSRAAYSACNYQEEHVAAPPAEARAAESLKPAQGSPTTPLRWSGNERPSVSASAPAYASSDSAAAPRPSDRSLGPKLKFKVERKLGVHNPSNGKGPKKKTLAELKELFIRLSSEKEEMEKEKDELFISLQSLRDKNILLKRELALKLSDKNPPSVVEMDRYSSAERILHSNHISSLKQDPLAPTTSSSHAFALPDLNMPAEDVDYLSGNMSIDFDSQLVQANSKAIIAAEARKYRMECLRLKHSQSVKAHLR